MHKSLVTMLTSERILLRVLRDLVVLEVLLAVESLTALSTLIKRMIHMFGLVLLELVLACERHLAMIARERSYIAVSGERVPLKMKRRLKRHATLLTRLVFGRVMQRGMTRKIFSCLERMPAQIA
jgi:hypothetical protein